MDIKNNKPHANKKGSYKQGYYKIYNSFKYKGDPTKCIYRSSWEFKCMKWLDDNPEVEWWASEPFCISYFYPAPYGDNKQHSYYPDLVFKIGDIVYVSEVKPSEQLRKPDKPKTNSQKALIRYRDAFLTYTKNYFKAMAAREWCSNKLNHKFVYITEESNLNNLIVKKDESSK